MSAEPTNKPHVRPRKLTGINILNQQQAKTKPIKVLTEAVNTVSRYAESRNNVSALEEIQEAPQRGRKK
jgi:hypothetical protein